MISALNRFCVLENQNFILEVCPEAGGSIICFQKKSADGTITNIFRPFKGDRQRKIDPFDCACLSMYPYTNRISNGVLVYKGKDYSGFPLHGEEHNALHGDGLTSVWEISKQTEHSLTITLDKTNGVTPYKYLARQKFSLGDEGLTIDMQMINKGNELPFAAGQHPYFPVKPNTRITSNLTLMELCDHEMQYVQIVPTPPEYDFSNGKLIADFHDTGKGFHGLDRLDNAFIGEGNTGLIEQPEDGIAVRINATPVSILPAVTAPDQTPRFYDTKATTIYIPPKNIARPEEDYVCFEPGMPNIVDEFNLYERGIMHRPMPFLRPEETYQSAITYHIANLH